MTSRIPVLEAELHAHLTISNLFPRPDQPFRGMYNLRLFTALQALGHEVLHLCLVPVSNPLRFEGVRRWRAPDRVTFPTCYAPYWHVPVVGRSTAWRMCQTSLQHFSSMASDFRPDVLFGSWLYPDGVAAGAWARSLGVPYGLMVLGSDTFHLNSGREARIVRACGQAAAVICVAEALRNRLVEAGVAAQRLHVVPNGVDTSLFHFRSREDAIARLSQTAASPPDFSKMTVLFVGNLVPIKGPDRMLDAWLQIVGKRPDAGYRLVFLGDGPMRRRLQRQVQRQGIGDCVCFLGSRPPEEVAWWMNAAEMLCLTSHSEGMPNVVLEALASGLPVVATDVGGVRQMLHDEPAGRVIERQATTAELAQSVLECLQRPVDRALVAKRNAERASWRNGAEQIVRHLLGPPNEPV